MRWLAAVFAAVVSLGVLYLSNQPSALTGGSDSTANIAAPSSEGQVAACVLVYAGLCLVAWRGFPGGRAARLAVTALSLMLLLLASHRVVVDGGRGLIRDIWLLVTVQTMTFDQRNGPAATASLERRAVWDTITPTTSDAPVVLIRGVPPLALDLAVVEVWWTDAKL